MPHAGVDDGGYVGSYVVDKTLGRGGSATVYLAHRVSDGMQVALKVLDQASRDAQQLARLEHRFELVRQLDHPHIVHFVERGPHWVAMRYVDGGDVSTTHSSADRFAALAQIADALDYTHRRGIIHCDVKPTNILVHQNFSDGGAVLIDFGVAHSLAEDMAWRLSRDSAARLSLDPAKRITHHGSQGAATVLASLPYAAPEILLGKMPSAATDEYSLACTAVELVTGSPPFAAATTSALVDAQLHREPPRLSGRIQWIPRSTDRVVAKALAKDPEMRYNTCAQFVEQFANSLR